jgi:hypothetical protein
MPAPQVHPRNLAIHSVSTLGHLGKFTLSLHWMNLGNQPVEILIEDVYLLVTPSPQGEEDPEEEANRTHAAKMERLENAELFHMRSQSEVAPGSCPPIALRSCVLSAAGPVTPDFYRRASHSSSSVLPLVSAALVISSTSLCRRGLPKITGSRSLADHQNREQPSGYD